MTKKMAGIAVFALFSQMSPAATIQNAAGINLGEVATNVNLTTTGPVDWALWSRSLAVPTQSKAGGTAISDLTIIKGVPEQTYAAGVLDATIFYSWTDGAPASSMVNMNPADSRLTSAGTSDLTGTGASLSFTVAGTTSLQTVTVWGCSCRVGATITASLGSNTVVTQIPRYDDSSNNIWVYSATFQADNPSDLLTLTVVPNDSVKGTAAQERLGIGAVTVGSPALVKTLPFFIVGLIK